MGFFKRKKKSSNIIAVGSTDSGSLNEPTTKKGGKRKSKVTKKSQKKQSKQPNKLNITLSLTSNDDDDDEISSVDLGDIPRSISTTTQSSPDSSGNNNNNNGYLLPPPAPQTPNREDGRNDEDSIGSPCEAMRRMNDANNNNERRSDNNGNFINKLNGEGVECALTKSPPPLTNVSTKKLLAKLASSQSPSIQFLPEYVAALTEVHSPDTSADLPSRALRALFSLSEHKESHGVRVAMVRDGVVDKQQQQAGGGTGGNNKNNNINNQKSAGTLIPALLTFLQRCPKDSSEQYLTLLVLNNLSIPMENKCLVALECGAANVLGRMLLEDVGCHLLVIIIVNLTFCDVHVRKSLLLGEGEGGGEDGDGEVQLIDCLAYALMVSC
eukprot:scaffold836_cov77-Skeletonema_dohrnii-CCMP3373.AAC.5